MYFVVTLALKILIYASVNCGFSGFAGLKLHLFIQPLVFDLWKMELATMQARLHRLTPFPSARRGGTSKIYCAESYFVAPFVLYTYVYKQVCVKV